MFKVQFGNTLYLSLYIINKLLSVFVDEFNIFRLLAEWWMYWFYSDVCHFFVTVKMHRFIFNSIFLKVNLIDTLVGEKFSIVSGKSQKMYRTIWNFPAKPVSKKKHFHRMFILYEHLNFKYWRWNSLKSRKLAYDLELENTKKYFYVYLRFYIYIQYAPQVFLHLTKKYMFTGKFNQLFTSV